MATTLSSQSNVDSLLAEAEKVSEDTSRLLLLLKASDGILYNDPDRAVQISNDALQLSKNNNFMKGINHSLGNLTTVYITTGKYDLAEELTLELRENAIKHDDETVLIRSMNRLGVIQYYKSEYQKGIETNLEILSMLSDRPVSGLHLNANNNIGINYEQLEEIDKAIEYYQIALKYAQELNNKYAEGAISGNIGVIYLHRKDLDKAKEYFLESIQVAEEINNQNLLIDETSNLTEVYILENQLTEAARINDRSLKVAQSVNDLNGILKATTQNGKIQFLQGQYRSSISSFLSSLSLANEIGDEEILLDIYELLYKGYEQVGNNKEAFDYLELYSAQKDSVFNIEKTKQLNLLETQYQVSEKERALLASQIEIEQKTSQRNQLLFLALLLGILGIGTYSILKYRIRKNKLLTEQSEQIHTQKIRELEKEKKILSMAAMIEGEEAERIRIAKDLHDGLGGLLATVRTQMGKVEQEISKLQNFKLYERTNAMIDQACTEVRRISQNLMPSVLRLEGLKGAVEDIVDQLQNVHGLKVNADFQLKDVQFTETQEMFIYRIIQELCNNIVKHAQATEVMIQLINYDDHFNIIVEDNGHGFDFEEGQEKGGLGIKSIKSRVDFLNGEIDIATAHKEGTSITINIPIENDPENADIK